MRRARTVRDAVRFVADASPSGLRQAVAVQVVSAGTSAALVVSGKVALDVLLAGEVSARRLAAPLTLLAVASAASTGLATWQSQQLRLLGEDVAVHGWQRLLRVSASAELERVQTPAFAEQLERVRDHALSRPLQITSALLGLVGGSLTALAMLGSVLVLAPVLLPLVAAAALPLAALARNAGRSEAAFARQTVPLIRRRFYLRLLLSHQLFAPELRAYELAPEFTTRHDTLTAEHRDQLARHVARRGRIALSGALTTGLATAGGLAVIVLLIGDGALAVSAAGAAVIAVRLLVTQVQRLLDSAATVIEAAPFLAEMQALFAGAPVAAPADPWRGPLELALDRVSYRYPGGDTDAIHEISLALRSGEVVALVGENGSGKSTLATVAAGLYPPSAGSVRIDGRAVTDLDRPSLRASTTTLFQDFARYQFTVAQNVAPAGDVGPDRIRDAVRRAGGADLVADLPRGLDTQLGREFNGGQDLSGGQWQRLALARALARDAPVLVLDEPTSALDPRAEADLLQRIRKATRDRAVLLVSHRYANLHQVDRIYVLDAGRLVEAGTHDELMAARGLYAELYSRQSAGYLPAPVPAPVPAASPAPVPAPVPAASSRPKSPDVASRLTPEISSQA